MKHARNDYDSIQDNTAAAQLAELVLSLNMITDKGLVARRLAREVLGIDDAGNAPAVTPITTNGTTRLIPRDEPVFLIRGQDAVGADAVRAWADLAERQGASSDIVEVARAHALRMDAWPRKKTADMPVGSHTPALPEVPRNSTNVVCDVGLAADQITQSGATSVALGTVYSACREPESPHAGR